MRGGRTGGPAGHLAGDEGRFAVFDQDELAGQDQDKLILALVPVAEGRAASARQALQMRAELRQPPGIAERHMVVRAEAAAEIGVDIAAFGFPDAPLGPLESLRRAAVEGRAPGGGKTAQFGGKFAFAQDRAVSLVRASSDRPR